MKVEERVQRLIIISLGGRDLCSNANHPDLPVKRSRFIHVTWKKSTSVCLETIFVTPIISGLPFAVTAFSAATWRQEALLCMSDPNGHDVHSFWNSMVIKRLTLDPWLHIFFKKNGDHFQSWETFVFVLDWIMWFHWPFPAPRSCASGSLGGWGWGPEESWWWSPLVKRAAVMDEPRVPVYVCQVEAVSWTHGQAVGDGLCCSQLSPNSTAQPPWAGRMCNKCD